MRTSYKHNAKVDFKIVGIQYRLLLLVCCIRLQTRVTQVPFSSSDPLLFYLLQKDALAVLLCTLQPIPQCHYFRFDLISISSSIILYLSKSLWVFHSYLPINVEVINSIGIVSFSLNLLTTWLSRRPRQPVSCFYRCFANRFSRY